MPAAFQTGGEKHLVELGRKRRYSGLLARGRLCFVHRRPTRPESAYWRSARRPIHTFTVRFPSIKFDPQSAPCQCATLKQSEPVKLTINGQTVEVAVRICQPSPRGALGRFWSNRLLGS